MATGCDTAIGGSARIDRQRSWRRGEQARTVAALGQQEAREAERQRRLADAARPREQPGMRQTSGIVGIE